MQPVGMVAVGVGGVLTEASGLSDGFGEVFGEVADVSSGFFGAAQDSLDVYLFPEAHHVCGLGQFLACLFPGGQRCAGVGVGERFGARVPNRQSVAGVAEMVVRWPPDLVVGRSGDRPQLGSRDGSPDGGMEVGCTPFLGFDSAEVLHVPAHTAAGVLQNRSTKAGKWIASRAARR